MFEPDKLNKDCNLNVCLVYKNAFDKVTEMKEKYPIFAKIIFIKAAISHVCFTIITTPLFEMLTLFVIISNSIMLALDDPTKET